MKNEEARLEMLNLSTNRNMAKNSKAVKLDWFGARLKILMTFYDKSSNDIALICHTRASTVNFWIVNVDKPTDKQINQLSFLFEVPSQFFTHEIVTITIKEQLNISYEKSEAQASEKGTNREDR
jgi:hypothetical protein